MERPIQESAEIAQMRTWIGAHSVLANLTIGLFLVSVAALVVILCPELVRVYGCPWPTTWGAR